jgi:Fatty acid hydroxylase superfamily
MLEIPDPSGAALLLGKDDYLEFLASLPRSGQPMNWLLSLPVALILMSGVEYVSHRWFMHRPMRWLEGVFRDHARTHHGQHYPPALYDQGHRLTETDRHFNVYPPYWWLTLIVLSPLIGLLWLAGWQYAVAFVAVIVVHNRLWGPIHREMHDPQYPWWSKTRVYMFWDSWHEAHHRHTNRNFAALLPFWDFILRTNAR